MLTYYLQLALRSFRRNLLLTALMVVAIGFGVGASMTTRTVLRILQADPIPAKSDRLFYVQLEPGKSVNPDHEPPLQVTRQDAEALVRARKADRQVLMTGGSSAVLPERGDRKPFFARARWTSADFFAMFDAPFVKGGGWRDDDDARNARVVVISRSLAERVFGSIDVIGRSMHVEGTAMQVVGVLDRWQMAPRFYDLTSSAYQSTEELFAPFSTSRELRLGRDGTMSCWGENGDPEAVGAPCTWIQLWVELGDAGKVAAYHDFLVRYSDEQRAAGRYTLPTNVRLRSVMEWLTYRDTVPDDVRLQTWLALAFFLVCMVNTVGLLLTKFLRRSAEIGVRRALGASKRSIFVQLLVEAGAVGLVGGVVGLGLTMLGLWAVRHQPAAYAALARPDLTMLASTFVVSVVASLLAGVLPAWRGCQITPAIQLKSQ
jgi:putative ABC transport system permease protein